VKEVKNRQKLIEISHPAFDTKGFLSFSSLTKPTTNIKHHITMGCDKRERATIY
jgi:hypothetical protein